MTLEIFPEELRHTPAGSGASWPLDKAPLSDENDAGISLISLEVYSSLVIGAEPGLRVMIAGKSLSDGETTPSFFRGAGVGQGAKTKASVKSLASAATVLLDYSSNFCGHWPAQSDSTKVSPFAFVSKGERLLAEALGELEELDDYAAEAEMQPPSPVAKKAARFLLKQLARTLPRDYAVSLWEDGDVTVYSSGGLGWRVSVDFHADGGATILVTRPDKRSREQHYESAQDLPIGVVVAALKEMPE